MTPFPGDQIWVPGPQTLFSGMGTKIWSLLIQMEIRHLLVLFRAHQRKLDCTIVRLERLAYWQQI